MNLLSEGNQIRVPLKRRNAAFAVVAGALMWCIALMRKASGWKLLPGALLCVYVLLAFFIFV